MSQVGLKPVLAALPTAKDEPPRQSGRFAIDPQRREIREAAPPSAAEARPEISQLLELNTLTHEELDLIAQRRRRQAARAPIVFAKPGEELDLKHPLTAYYREPTLERVQLQFEDRSLDPTENPLAHSSLLPPPRPAVVTFPRALAVGAAGLAVLSVGYLAAVAVFGGRSHSAQPSASARGSAPHLVVLELPVGDGRTSDVSTALKAPAPAQEDVPWSVAEATGAPLPAAPSPAPFTKALTAPPPAAAADAAPAQPVNRPRALGQRARARAGAAAVQAAALPTQPSREEIKGVIETARAALQACAGNQHGTFKAHISITGAGRVASATIEGAFAGTPQGSCMARSLRGFVFPRFSNPTLQVTYPFRM